MFLAANVSSVSAYIIGVCVSIVLILVAALIAKLISFSPDLSDVTKRKVWFWILAILCPVLTFALCYFIVYSGIKIHSQQDSYMFAMCIAALISLVLYVILGFVSAKISKTGKISNWF